MAITFATYSSYVEAASTAIVAGDWSTAETQAAAAQAVLTALPDSEFDGNRTNFETCQRGVEALLRTIERGQSRSAGTAAGGMRSTLINYVDPTE